MSIDIRMLESRYARRERLDPYLGLQTDNGTAEREVFCADIQATMAQDLQYIDEMR